MNWLDIVIIVILLFFFWKGFRAGLVGAIGGFLGIIVGIWAGSHFMTQVAGWLMRSLSMTNQSLANILGFIAIFILINIIFSIIVWIINKIFNIIPFIDLANKLAGSLVGVIGGVLAVAALVYLLSLFSFSDAIAEVVEESQLAAIALSVAVIIKPLIPEAIKSVKEII
ncbi:CvpA family protein [bacterium]|jgi:membrane protein required for colicin V production|nr:CvpA family protein [bacterium]MBT4648767.1 CvpA family protein [bacterium]